MERHHVQWAAQFATAAELCRRKYSVSFTMGNATPVADLLVMAPSGAAFSIDVKGQSTPNFWRIKAKSATQGLFYALCYVAAVPEQLRFFILPQAEVLRLMHGYAVSGVKYDERFSGFNWTAPNAFEDRWDLLPR